MKQFKDLFTQTNPGHLHPADPGALRKVTITAKVKKDARENVHRPAGDIVETTMEQMTTRDDFALPKPTLLARTANRHRQKLRPKEPATLDFDIDIGFLGENFILDDIRVDDQRHIVMATQDQLQTLKEARRWFIDGTFKIVRKPFFQLMSIHAFIRRDDDVKQVPLVYVLMSRRAKQDYIAVLRSLRQKMGEPLVEWIMLDFEAGTYIIQNIFYYINHFYDILTNFHFFKNKDTYTKIYYVKLNKLISHEFIF